MYTRTYFQFFMLLLFSFVLLSCDSDNDISNAKWIGILRDEQRHVDDYLQNILDTTKDESFKEFIYSRFYRKSENREILGFHTDTLNTVRFSTSKFGFDNAKLKFERQDDSIFIEKVDGGIYKCQIGKMTREELILNHMRDNTRITFSYKRLRSFNLGNRSQVFISMLLDNSFRNTIDNEVLRFSAEYTDDQGTVSIVNTENENNWNRWCVTAFEDELFLFVGESLIQIESIYDTGFSGQIYKDINLKVKFTKVLE